MSNRNYFWYCFAEIVYHHYYLIEYKQLSIFYNKCWNYCIALTSSISIAAWAIWGKFPFAWAIITAAAQLASLWLPYLQFKEQVLVINLLESESEYEDIINQMENTWLKIDSFSNNEIADLCTHYKSIQSRLLCKYISQVEFPDRKHCMNIAMDKRDAFLHKFLSAHESEVAL